MYHVKAVEQVYLCREVDRWEEHRHQDPQTDKLQTLFVQET